LERDQHHHVEDDDVIGSFDDKHEPVNNSDYSQCFNQIKKVKDHNDRVAQVLGLVVVAILNNINIIIISRAVIRFKDSGDIVPTSFVGQENLDGVSYHDVQVDSDGIRFAEAFDFTFDEALGLKHFDSDKNDQDKLNGFHVHNSGVNLSFDVHGEANDLQMMRDQHSSHAELDRDLSTEESVFAWFVTVEVDHDQRNLCVNELLSS
jgi:hypothetical protein